MTDPVYFLEPKTFRVWERVTKRTVEVRDPGILAQPPASVAVLVAAGVPVTDRGSALLESYRRVSA